MCFTYLIFFYFFNQKIYVLLQFDPGIEGHKIAKKRANDPNCMNNQLPNFEDDLITVIDSRIASSKSNRNLNSAHHPHQQQQQKGVTNKQQCGDDI